MAINNPATLGNPLPDPGILDTIEKKKEAFLRAYKNSLGCITDACAYVKIHPETYYEYMTDEDFKKEMSYVDLAIRDFVRKALFKEIQSGTITAIKYYYDTDGLNNFADKSVQATLQVLHEDVEPIDKPKPESEAKE